MGKRFLVGDIGGTKTLLGLGDRVERFESKNYSSLEEILALFLKGEKVDKACFGIAGPVKENKCQVTNLSWFVDGDRISKQFHISRVILLNDIIASAYGIEGSKQEVLYQGMGKGNQAILSPGTGLGEALIINGVPIASEGGHADFAPQTERDIELYRKLKQTRDHVSYEDVLREGGINLNRDMDWFCEILGSEAGNLALKGLATGGVFLGGGVIPHILDTLKNSSFLKSFFNKGKLSDLMKTISVIVLLDPNIVLRGALAALYKN